MDISVEELTSVDKELTISAQKEDVQPKIDAAYKKYKKQIDMPGFRPGKVPVSIIRKRFGKAIEEEEINKYIQEIFEQEIVPEYEPVGETEMTDMTWEDGELEAKFKIGSKPEFELVDLSEIEVDKMVHDVTDEEVEEELERIIDNAGDWEEVDQPVSENVRVTVDAQALDDEGKPKEGDLEEDQVLDMQDESNKEFLDALEGLEVGDEVNVDFGGEEDDDAESFEITIKKIEQKHEPELNDEFAKEQSNGEAETVEEFKSFMKSQIQQYYDKSAEDLLKQDIVKALVDAHDIPIPEMFKKQLLNMYVEQLKQKNDVDLPDDFDEKLYKEQNEEQALRDGKWQFLNDKLQEKFDDIEIKPEDIDEYLEAEGARYGVPVDQMKQIYAQNADQLERLRSSIRQDKVFDRLIDELSINEISKDEYQEKHEDQKAEN
mgnify:CR=1 FL=1